MSLRRDISAWACGLLAVGLAVVPSAPARAQPDDEPETQILSRGEGIIAVGRQRAPLPWAESALGPLIALAPVVEVLGGELEVGPLGEAHTLRVAGREVVLGPLGRVVLVDDEMHMLSIKPWLEPEPERREPRRRTNESGGERGAGSERLGAGDEGAASEDGDAPAPGLAAVERPPWHLYVPVDALTRAYTAEQGYRFAFDRRRGRLEVSGTGEHRLAVEVERVHDLGATTLVVTFSGRPRYRVDEVRGGVRIRLLSGVLEPRPRFRLNDPLVRWLEVRDRSIEIGLAPRAEASEPYILGRPPRVQLVMDITRDRTGRMPRALSRHDEETGEFRVVLDPGHGGADTGVSSPSGITEKDLVLVVAEELRSHLASSLGARVVLTRTDDSNITLENRTAAANHRRADLFLSLHVSPDSAWAADAGFQAYILDPPPAVVASAEEDEPGPRGTVGVSSSSGAGAESAGLDEQDANPSHEAPDEFQASRASAFPGGMTDRAGLAERSSAGARMALEGEPVEDGEWGEPIGDEVPDAGELGEDGFDDPGGGMEDGGQEIPVAVPALELWERVQDSQLERSGLLARLIQSHVSDALDQPNRRVGRAPLRVLTGASMPAVLIELGALGGDDEEGTPLLDDAHRRVLIEAIGRAIRLYRGLAAGGVGAAPDGAGP